MSELSRLGEVINERIQKVAAFQASNVPVESGVIITGGGLQVESLDNVIPPSDYIVLNDTVSEGDKVVVAWAEDDPYIIGVIGDTSPEKDYWDLRFLCAVPMTASERAESTDELGNAIYDAGFTDVVIS